LVAKNRGSLGDEDLKQAFGRDELHRMRLRRLGIELHHFARGDAA
jgi:hypothetical protein